MTPIDKATLLTANGAPHVLWLPDPGTTQFRAVYPIVRDVRQVVAAQGEAREAEAAALEFTDMESVFLRLVAER